MASFECLGKTRTRTQDREMVVGAEPNIKINCVLHHDSVLGSLIAKFEIPLAKYKKIAANVNRLQSTS